MVSKSETVADITDIESTLAQYHDAVARNRGGRLEAIAAAIDGGHALNQLREQAQHGDWEGWVEREGQTLRTAHNWRKLAETGLTAEQVVEQGGMVAVLRARNATRPSDEIDDMESVLEGFIAQFSDPVVRERQQRHLAQIEEFKQRLHAQKAELEAGLATGLIATDFKARMHALSKEIHTLRNEQRVRLGEPEIDFETDYPGGWRPVQINGWLNGRPR